MSSAFSLLQEAQNLKYQKYVFKKFSELEIGDYEVSKLKLFNSKYGPFKTRLAVLMEGTPSSDETTVICLPDRFTAAIHTQEEVSDLNKKKYVMSYKGSDPSQHNRIDVFLYEVVENEDDADGMDIMN